MDIQVSGVDTLVSGLGSALAAIPKLEPRTVGDIILSAARARVPVDTGALRASGRVQGMTVTYVAPYAAPIHWGWRARNIEPNPFLVKGTASAADLWLDAFSDAIQTELDRKV
jgi:hypothetical protein